MLATALLLAVLPGLAASASPPQQAQVHPAVSETLDLDGEVEVLVILRQQADLLGTAALRSKQAKGHYVYQELWSVAEKSQRGLRAMLEARRAEYQPFYIVNALRVRADRVLVHALAARPEVGRILPNPRVRGVPSAPPLDLFGGHLGTGPPDLEPTGLLVPSSSSNTAGIEPNLLRVNADDVWTLGYTGQGIVVAGQDTGYDWDHPALKKQYRGWNGSSADHDYNWHDAIHGDDPNTPPGNPCGFDSAEPCDDHGHGTHTMGVLAGDDSGSNRIGMAPGARWIGCRNMEQGWGTPATYLECFEFFLAPYPRGGTPAEGLPELAPYVVNNSWGCPPQEGCDAAAAALLELSVEKLRQAGIVVVASAGNSGSTGCGSVNNPPALYRQSLTAGAFSHVTDGIASFSSRGPVIYSEDLYAKPDITAPGVDIRSCLPDGAYASKQGTSMAAPHVAGAVALLLSAAPGLSGDVDAVEQILTHTAEPKSDSQCGDPGPPNNVWGWGILDALAAVESVTEKLLGAVSNAKDSSRIVSATVAVNGTGGPRVLTDASGHYALALVTGVYSLTAQATGYYSQTIPNVEVFSGQVTIQDFVLAPRPQVYLPLVARAP